MGNDKNEWTITYKQIGIIVVSFVLGVIIALLFSNSQTNAITNFTTTELIGFVLTVVISGGSIVLAIAAIALGRSSEQAVINRSDESIRLQTELFTKTTDALQSIKASTGVTEKRIEDIIAGRAGEISKQLAELASDETVSGKVDIRELEEKIRQSITGTLEKEETDEEKRKRIERREKMRKQRDDYEKSHSRLMYSIANLPNTKILKIGHGSPLPSQTEPFSKFDGVFNKDGKTIAVSTFMPTNYERYVKANVGDILTNFAQGMEADKVDQMHLVFFKTDEEDTTGVLNEAEKSLSVMKDEFSSKIFLHSVSYEDIDSFSEKVH